MAEHGLASGEGIRKAYSAQDVLNYMVEMSMGRLEVDAYLNPDDVMIESEASALIVDGFQVPDELVERTGVRGIGISYKPASSSWLNVLQQNPGCSVAQIGVFKVPDDEGKKLSSAFADNYFIESANKKAI